MAKETHITEIVANPTDVEIRGEFTPYAAKLGSLVYVWNDLHDSLALLFWVVTGITNGLVPLAIWHSTDSDRAQRRMLQSAVNATAAAFDAKFKHAKFKVDLTWLIDRTNSLADQRNDAIHSPYWFVGPPPMQMIPNDFQGNPRAKKLKDKDLLREFTFCADTAVVLTEYARQLAYAIRNSAHVPWPDKPSLPNRGQKKTPRDRHLQPLPK